jgi:hypothetical protein
VIEFLGVVAAVALGWLCSAWLLMLTIGIAHAQWVPALPTIGFVPALLIAGLLAARMVVTASCLQIIKKSVDD